MARAWKGQWGKFHVSCLMWENVTLVGEASGSVLLHPPGVTESCHCLLGWERSWGTPRSLDFGAGNQVWFSVLLRH